MAKPKGTKDLVIDHKQLKDLMNLRPSVSDVAGFYGCTRQAIHYYIKRHFDQTFLEFRDENMHNVKLSLAKKAIEMAKRGDKEMLKFCLINLNKWSNGFAKSNFDNDEDYIDDLEFVDANE